MTIIHVSDTSQWCSVMQKWKQILSTSIPVKNLGASLFWDVSVPLLLLGLRKGKLLHLSFLSLSSDLVLCILPPWLHLIKQIFWIQIKYWETAESVLSTWYETPHLSFELNYVFSVKLQKYPSGSSRLQNILEIITALASRELTYKKNRLCYNKHLLNGCNKIK